MHWTYIQGHGDPRAIGREGDIIWTSLENDPDEKIDLEILYRIIPHLPLRWKLKEDFHGNTNRVQRREIF